MNATEILDYTRANGGGTFKYVDGWLVPVTSGGYVVAYAGKPDSQVIPLDADTTTFWQAVTAINFEYLPDFIGAWVHEGQIYIDPVEFYENYTEAVDAGRANNQIAIFNLDTMEEITL